MTTWKVSITYRAAEIIADLLPGKHLSNEALQAVTEFLSEIARAQKQMDEEKDPDS
jgi:hypothetical protein